MNELAERGTRWGLTFFGQIGRSYRVTRWELPNCPQFDPNLKKTHLYSSSEIVVG